MDKTKVISLKKDEVLEALKILVAMAERGEIEGMVAAGMLSSGEVFTISTKVDTVQQHMLSSYIHTNTILKIVQENSLI